MANTRNLTREERKTKKRAQRRANKALFAGLSSKERTEFYRSEKTLKAYLKEKGKV